MCCSFSDTIQRNSDIFPATSSTSPERVLQLTESPLITIAKGDTLVHIQPTAIAFWEKLGLGPKGGKKDVTAYALFQEVDESHRSSVASWLRNLSSEYTVCTSFSCVQYITHGYLRTNTWAAMSLGKVTIRKRMDCSPSNLIRHFVRTLVSQVQTAFCRN